MNDSEKMYKILSDNPATSTTALQRDHGISTATIARNYMRILRKIKKITFMKSS